jgi:hypothetical protein
MPRGRTAGLRSVSKSGSRLRTAAAAFSFEI